MDFSAFCSLLEPEDPSPSSRSICAEDMRRSNSHGARPVHLIITMIKWIRARRLSIKNASALRICAGPLPHVLHRTAVERINDVVFGVEVTLRTVFRLKKRLGSDYGIA